MSELNVKTRFATYLTVSLRALISIVLTYQKYHLVEYYLVGARSCEATRYCLGLPGFNMIGLPAQRDGIREGYSA